MIKELPKGILPGSIESIRGSKLIIAEMPKESADSETKTLIYRLQLRNPDELKGKIDDQPETLGNIDVVKNKILELQKKQELNNTDWHKFKEKKAIKRKTKKKSFDLKIQNEKNALLRDLAYKPVSISAFVVKEYERALFMIGGRMVGVIPPGLYQVDKAFQNTSSEIFWINMVEFQFYWGLSAIDDEVYSQDSARIGASGSINLQVNDPKSLVLSLSSKKSWMTQEDIESSVTPLIISGIKMVVQKYDVASLINAREEIQAAIRANISSLLEKWGLEPTTFIIEHVKLPEEMEDLLQDRFQSKLERERIEIDHSGYKHKKAASLDKLNVDDVFQSKKTKLEWDRKMEDKQRQSEEDALEWEHKREKKQRQSADEKLEWERAKDDKQRKSTEDDLEWEMRKKKLAHELEMDKLSVKKAEIRANKAGLERDIKSEDALSDIDVKQIQQKAAIALKAEESKLEDADKLRAHELALRKLEINREVELAKLAKTTRSAPRDKSNSGRLKDKITRLELRLMEKEGKIEKLDELLMAEKISKDIYEIRMKSLIEQTDALRVKIDVLEDKL
ncbi:MAG: SPFH domain-containing protein [Promethearchaeota archaeon]